ncbi:MAG TPA: BatA domain-containing protein, partial [Gemmataceae bacterium]|nr:BatA domain-containing protein [Gemmataceae bacterium]
MSFVHPLLLGGLLLVGIPVLIHLIMQQKPKRLLFPAFRFLVLKHRTNQRRLRLRHLLLLALRVLLIAAICFALARPKLFSNRLGIGSDRPVAAVLLFDTSLSMGYQVSKQTRLDEAKQRALELLATLPNESRIAVLDSGEVLDNETPGGEWLNRAQAEERITGLKLRPMNGPITRRISQAYRLFTDLDKEQADSSETLPRILCVFSDRTTACWDASEVKGLTPPEGLNSVFVDVGVDNPVDLAIAGLEIPRQVVRPGGQAEIRATVRAAGSEGVNDLVWQRVPEPRDTGEPKVERSPVQLAAGQSLVKAFKGEVAPPNETAVATGGLTPGFHQFEMRFDNGDALPFDDRAFATVKVQEGRRILIVTDHPGKDLEKGDAGPWLRALKASHEFPCDVISTDAANSLGLVEMSKYEAICLIDVAKPSKDLWERIDKYVGDSGKGLAIVVGGEDWRPSRDDYTKDPGRKILGAKLDQLKTHGDGKSFGWKQLEPDTPKATLHPLVRFYRDQWDLGEGVRFVANETLPRARCYWKVVPDAAGAQPIAFYADEDNTPALLENRYGKGRVLIVTTAFDGHKVKNLDANNYFVSWFGPYFIIQVTGYLAGDAEAPNFNYVCGQVVTVPLPPTQALSFTLFGPDANGIVIPRTKGESQLRITQAVQPGNYRLYDPTLPPP